MCAYPSAWLPSRAGGSDRVVETLRPPVFLCYRKGAPRREQGTPRHGAHLSSVRPRMDSPVAHPGWLLRVPARRGSTTVKPGECWSVIVSLSLQRMIGRKSPPPPSDASMKSMVDWDLECATVYHTTRRNATGFSTIWAGFFLA